MDIVSPKDGIVLSVAVADGAHVNPGDVLCTLSDDEENIALKRLALAQSVMAVDQNLLSPAQVQAQRRMVQIGVEIANKYVDFATAKRDFEQNAITAGTGDPLRLKQAEAALQKAKGEQEKAQIALQTFDFNVQQALARQNLATAHIPDEIAFVNAVRGRLAVKTPTRGAVKLLIGAGSFLRKGNVLAQVSQP